MASGDALPSHPLSRQKISSMSKLKGLVRTINWKPHTKEQRPGRSLTQPSEDEYNDLVIDGVQNYGWEVLSPRKLARNFAIDERPDVDSKKAMNSAMTASGEQLLIVCRRSDALLHFESNIQSIPVGGKRTAWECSPAVQSPASTENSSALISLLSDCNSLNELCDSPLGDSCSQPYFVPLTPLVLRASSCPSPEMPPPFTPSVQSRMRPATPLMPRLQECDTGYPFPSPLLPPVTPIPRRNSSTYPSTHHVRSISADCVGYDEENGEAQSSLEGSEYTAGIPPKAGKGTVGRGGGKKERHQRSATVDMEVLGSLQEAEDSAIVAKLLHALQTGEDGDGGQTRRAAAKELRRFAKSRPQMKEMIVKAGGTEILVECLREGDPSIEEDCVTALFHTLESEECRNRLCEVGGIDALVEVLESSSQISQENAAAALFLLSESLETRMLVRIAGGVKSLVALLGGPSLRGRKDAALALFKLSLDADCAKEVVRVGGVTVLLRLITDPLLEEKVAAVILNLSRVAEGRKEILGEVETVPALAAVIEGGSQRAKEDATGVLLLLAKTSSAFVQVVIEEGIIPTLNALLQTGTRKARFKASALLDILRGKEGMEVKMPSKHVLRVVGGSPLEENKPQEWWQLALAHAQAQMQEGT